MNSNITRRLTYHLTAAALATSLVAAVTMVVKIPTPTGGYLNLGDYAIMMLIPFFPLGSGIFIAGFGSACADILSGYAHYAPFTFFIKGGEAVILIVLIRCLTSRKRIIPFTLCGLWMMLMYAFVSVILSGQISGFLLALKGDIFQAGVAVVLATITYPSFNALIKRYGLRSDSN